MEQTQWTKAEVLERLEVLYRALDHEGQYVQANTAHLAAEMIRNHAPADAVAK